MQNSITLNENNQVTTDKELVAEKLNTFFIETVDNLDIERFSRESIDEINDKEINEILKIYELHPSIIKIKENISSYSKFI